MNHPRKSDGHTIWIHSNAVRREVIQTALISAWILFAGCNLIDPHATVEKPSPSLGIDTYSAKVESELGMLGSFDAEADQETLAIPMELRQSANTIARDFHQAIKEYKSLVYHPQPPWASLTASSFKLLLRDCHFHYTILARLRDDFSKVNHSISKHLDQQVGNSTDAESIGTVSRDMREYVARCAALDADFSKLKEQLFEMHEANLSPDIEVEHPAEKVLHFMRLLKLECKNSSQHANVYRGAWKAWLRLLNSQSQPDDAMALLAFVFTHSGQYAPKDLNDIGTVVEPCITHPPILPIVETMEKHLSVIEKVYKPKPTRRKLDQREFNRARAVFALCRAHAAKDPEIGISLAVSAIEQERQLVEMVGPFLLGAGQKLAEKYERTVEYARAIRIFSRKLETINSPTLKDLAWQYRLYVFDKALSDYGVAIGNRQLDTGREILTEASEIAIRQNEHEKVRRLLYSHYTQHASALETGDVDAFLRICREWHKFFPSDRRARSMVDKARIRFMQNKIGDLKTSYRRMSAKQILQVMRETTSRILTEEGITACQTYLRHIQTTWSTQLDKTTNPHDAFVLARELGSLAGESPDVTKARGAQAVNNLLAESVRNADWTLLEKCIVAHFSTSSRTPIVSNFKETYKRLLSKLNESGEATKLIQHLMLFSAAYPRSTELVKRYLVEHLNNRSEEHVSFYALLKRMLPLSNEVKAYEKANSIEGFDVQSHLRQIVDVQRYAHVRRWLDNFAEKSKNPSTISAPPSGQEATGVSTIARNKVGSTTRTQPASGERCVTMLLGAGIVGSVLLPLLLVFGTRKRGFFAFRWYGLTALWIGITLGILLAK